MSSAQPMTATDVATTVRAASTAEHRNAESRPFIIALMGGQLTLAHYTRYLAQFARVYEALESEQQTVDAPELFDPALARSASIDGDLNALGAPDWRSAHPPLPATRRYLDRLHEIDDLPRRVAHHYTRYLGDLSGGQAIAALVARHYGATSDQLSYFRFTGILNLVHYKRGYRDGINALGFSESEQAALVSEVKLAYAMNAAVFDDLAD